jgi:redox-sensing transcriptional repressor
VQTRDDAAGEKFHFVWHVKNVAGGAARNKGNEARATWRRLSAIDQNHRLVTFHKLMIKAPIPRKAVYRLSVYYRCLQKLKTNKISTVSSAALAKVAGVKPPQLRKDLTYFGQFGTRGLGYDVDALTKKLTDVLGTARLQPVVLVGAGHLGAALVRYQGFAREGFEVVGAFDLEPKKRAMIGGVPVLPMTKLKDFISEKNVKVAILTVPGTAAQEVANELVAAGIQALLNFAPQILQVPDGVVVNNVDLAIELENLSYFIQ